MNRQLCPYCLTNKLVLIRPARRRHDLPGSFYFVHCENCSRDLGVIDMNSAGDWHDMKYFAFRDIARNARYGLSAG